MWDFRGEKESGGKMLNLRDFKIKSESLLSNLEFTKSHLIDIVPEMERTGPQIARWD